MKVKDQKNTYFLIWTTTPWTLPGNVATAVSPSITYVKAKVGSDYLILAKKRLAVLGKEYKVVEEFKGKETQIDKWTDSKGNAKIVKSYK